jgi:hypothetical protein
MGELYDSQEWRALCVRVRARDGDRCTVQRLLGGACHPQLHVHHLIPVSEGGLPIPHDDDAITVCQSHHPLLEGVRRAVLRARDRHVRRCPHAHRTREAREACERRLNRAA